MVSTWRRMVVEVEIGRALFLGEVDAHDALLGERGE
jgi:hypothetical protein